MQFWKSPFIVGALVLAGFGACSSTPVGTSDSDTADRGPIGKADAFGSCAAPDEASPDFCGGPSAGNCWCDELCEGFGDCCSDKAAVCDGGDDDGVHEPAECLSSAACGAGEFCQFEAECGEGPVGVCLATPLGCNKLLAPVCGCDAVTYDNECFAAAAGISVQSQGACPEDEPVSCEGHCGDNADGACWCDELCSQFGDCCGDYIEQCEAPEPTCDELETAFVAQTAAIRSCEDDTECGQVLTGTSCGCTRNWVARTDADITEWEATRAAALDGECGIGGGISTCDCPAADGFACDAGICTWNYL